MLSYIWACYLFKAESASISMKNALSSTVSASDPTSLPPEARPSTLKNQLVLTKGKPQGLEAAIDLGKYYQTKINK